MGNEVDLLYPHALKFDIFEIKSSQTIMSAHLKGLNFLQDLAPDAVSKKRSFMAAVNHKNGRISALKVGNIFQMIFYKILRGLVNYCTANKINI